MIPNSLEPTATSKGDLEPTLEKPTWTSTSALFIIATIILMTGSLLSFHAEEDSDPRINSRTPTSSKPLSHRKNSSPTSPFKIKIISQKNLNAPDKDVYLEAIIDPDENSLLNSEFSYKWSLPPNVTIQRGLESDEMTVHQAEHRLIIPITLKGVSNSNKQLIKFQISYLGPDEQQIFTQEAYITNQKDK